MVEIIDRDAHAATESERTNNTLRAYRQIRQRIMNGDMPAGSQFLEQELAEILGMSRTPVREALIRLSDERLVEVRPRHGARVLGVSADELNDIYEICSQLEAMAARRVADRGLSDVELQRLEAACSQMDEAAAKNDFNAWVVGDQTFHETIVSAAGISRLDEIWTSLMTQVHRARHITMAGRNVPVHSNLEHREILAAMKSRESAHAHALMFEHRNRSRTVLVDLLRKGTRA